MSDMRPRDLQLWAKEEMAEAVKLKYADWVENSPESTFDERTALAKQRDRVLRFLKLL